MTRLAVIAALLCTAPVHAQLAGRNQIGVTMGHMHLLAQDVDAQKRFWTSVMGGTPLQNGPLELIQFPGVFIMQRKGVVTSSVSASASSKSAAPQPAVPQVAQPAAH